MADGNGLGITQGPNDLRGEFGGARRAAAGNGEQGPLIRFQSGLLAHGSERAVESGALEPRAEDLSALEEHAKAMACDAYRDKYDPAANPNDRLREDRFLHASKRRLVVAEAIEHAQVAFAQREDDLSQVPSATSKPEVAIILAFGAVLILALTVAPTLRDFLFDSLEDEVLAWTASFGAALGFGLFLAWVTLGSAGAADLSETTGEKSGRNKVLIGGAVVTVGLGVWRLSAAEAWSDYATAAALTALELGVILLLDWFASEHRKHLAAWQRRHDTRAAGEAAVAAIASDLKRRENELAKLEAEIEAHIEYVEDRTLRNLSIDELIKAATTAVRDGYNGGIAANRGRTRGGRR